MARISVCVSVVCISVFLAACGSSDNKSGKFLDRGKEFAEKKDYARAILQFRNEAKLLPNNPEPYYQLGLAYLAMHDPRTAYAHFQKAVQLDPKHAGAQIKLAEMVASSDNKELRKEAEDRANNVLKQSPGDPDALAVLGVAEAASGHSDAGEEQLRQALERAPGHLKSAVLLARMRLKEKDFAGAEAVLKSVVAKDPKSVDAALALGQLYAGAQRHEDAIRQYERAVQLQPDRGISLLLLAQQKIAVGRTAEGEQAIQKLSALPDKQYRNAHASYLLESGKIDAGLKELEQNYKKDSNDRGTRVLLTRIYQVLNREEDAEKLLVAALKLNPKDTEALLQRSEMLIKRGDHTQAQNDIAQVLRITPDSADAHRIMAKLHQHRGSQLQARQELIEALRLNPEMLDARLEIAEIDLNSGSASNAMEWITKVPENQVSNPALIAKRIKILLGMNRTAEARKELDAVLKKGRSREFLMLDAQARLTQKDFSGARASAEEVLKASPEDIPALDVLAASYAFEKRPALALQRVKEQVALRPGSARLQHRLSAQLLAAQDLDGSRQALVECLRLDPAYIPAALDLSRLDIKQGKNDDARKRLTALLAAKKSEASVHLLLAQLDINTSNIPAAIEHYRSVLNQDSNNLIALNNLSSLLADQTGGADEALKYAQQLKELAPNEPLTDDTLGWAFYQKGLYGNAVQYLRTAATKQQNPVSKYRLAMAYFKLGDTTNAQKTLAAALRERPNVPEAEAAQKLIASR